MLCNHQSLTTVVSADLDGQTNQDHFEVSDNCTQYSGEEGTCRPTIECLFQQPNQQKWNTCQWHEWRPVPTSVCCFSDKQLWIQLLKETNEYEGQESDQTMERDSEQICGISKVVSRMIPFSALIKRSKDEFEFYDMLFPAAYRVVMGNNVMVGQIPWMVAIYYHRKFVCGGSIIDHRHIITAAHCFEISR